MIVDNNKEYWGALTKIGANVRQVQIFNKKGNNIHEIFKFKKNVVFVTNADNINIEGIGNVGTTTTLWEGSYNVTFSKEDFESETINLIVTDDMTVSKNLNRSHGQLNINSNPSGASIYMNNTNMGVTPLSLNHFDFGNYVISLTKANYQSDTFPLSFNIHGQNVLRTLIPTPEPIPEPEPPVVDVPPLVKPAPTAPVISVSNITQNSAKITFTSSNVTSYDVYVNNVFKANTSSTTYQLSSLKASTVYSIKIVAKGNGTAQNTKSFTTLAPVIPTPTAPSIYDVSAAFMDDLNYGIVLIKFKSTSSSHVYFKIDGGLVDKHDSNGISLYSNSNLSNGSGANREGWVKVKCHLPNYPSWVKFKFQVRSYYSSTKYSPIAEKTFRAKIVKKSPYDYINVTVV